MESVQNIEFGSWEDLTKRKVELEIAKEVYVQVWII